jgi:hypothetical protein
VSRIIEGIQILGMHHLGILAIFEVSGVIGAFVQDISGLQCYVIFNVDLAKNKQRVHR